MHGNVGRVKANYCNKYCLVQLHNQYEVLSNVLATVVHGLFHSIATSDASKTLAFTPLFTANIATINDLA